MSFSLQKITINDSKAVQELLTSCSDYFQMAEDKTPDAITLSEFFEDCPPSHTLEDKISLGIYDNDQLIGIVDMLQNYVSQGEWMIGLLLLHPSCRGKKLGEQVHQELIQLAQQGGASLLRIGVVAQNEKGLAFWKRLGYLEISRTAPIRFGNRDNVVVVLRLELNKL